MYNISIISIRSMHLHYRSRNPKKLPPELEELPFLEPGAVQHSYGVSPLQDGE